ncbi:MAG TPA: response regulator [Polyangiaceae bacterium]
MFSLEDATGTQFLLVEDDVVLRRQLARIIRPFGDLALAASAAEARGVLAGKHAWDGFVIDFALPDGSGLDLLAEARIHSPDTPAVVLSESTDAGAINGAFDLGAAFLVKPFTEPRIRRFLEAAASGEGAPLGPTETARGLPAVMPRSLPGCVEQLRALFSNRQDVPTRYAIGATVSAIKARPHLFGTGAVLAVATALKEDLTTLYRHAAVAEQWTPAEMEQLEVRRGRDGRSLSWSHITVLGALTDRDVRARLVTRAIDEGLSVRELTGIVAAELGPRPRPPR